MPGATERRGLEKEFAEVEASFRMEGMDPSGDALYRKAKEQVLDGRMKPEEALAWLVEQSRLARDRVA